MLAAHEGLRSGLIEGGCGLLRPLKLACGGLVEWLGRSSGGVGVGDARLLGRRQTRNKGVGVCGVGRECLPSGLLSDLVYLIVARQDFGRDLNRLSRSGTFPAHNLLRLIRNYRSSRRKEKMRQRAFQIGARTAALWLQYGCWTIHR